MNTTPPPPDPAAVTPRRPRVRRIVLIPILALAVLIGWAYWPAAPEISPYELSSADGKSRFYVTKPPARTMPPNLSLGQQLLWKWDDFRKRHQKPNPARFTFSPMRVQPCLLSGLLSQCTEVAGTKYFIAVEIAGAINFGFTNSLGGGHWVTAFEHAIETNAPVVCRDYSKKTIFEDTLLVIRERPGVVKIVPRTKHADYQKAGLVSKTPR